MLLQGKIAVIYGGGGAVGGAIARTFAREGAAVHLAGRTLGTAQVVAKEITSAGGQASAEQVDALDETAVEAHLAELVARSGRIDISLNAVGLATGEQGLPLIDHSLTAFEGPVTGYARAHFLTARAAGRQMIRQGAGVILPVTAPIARMPAPLAGSFGAGFAAVETFARQLAAELGPTGVRVVCLRPTGMPESVTQGSHAGRIWERAAERMGLSLDEMLAAVGGGTARQRPMTLAELAEVAALVASDRASAMTATVANVSCGAVPD